MRITKKQLIEFIQGIPCNDDATVNISLGDEEDGGDITPVGKLGYSLHPEPEKAKSEFCIEFFSWEPRLALLSKSLIIDVRCPGCNFPVIGTEQVISSKEIPTIPQFCTKCQTPLKVVKSPEGELTNYYIDMAKGPDLR